jgi:hypothetical protein
MTTKKKKSKPAKSKKSKPIKGKAVKKSKPIKGKAVKKSKPIKAKTVKKSKPIKGKTVKKSKPIKGKTFKKSKPIKRQSSGYIEGRAGELYFNKESNLKKQVAYAKKIKTLPTKKQAIDWWKGIGGGSSYFVIAKVISKKTKQEGYAVFDIRTQRERGAQKSKLDGVSRARQLLLELGEDESEE